jgi:hypothetical protein
MCKSSSKIFKNPQKETKTSVIAKSSMWIIVFTNNRLLKCNGIRTMLLIKDIGVGRISG